MVLQIGVTDAADFIPLDDTVRLKSSAQSGERARLVREDENDMSDEEETGRYIGGLRNDELKKQLHWHNIGNKA